MTICLEVSTRVWWLHLGYTSEDNHYPPLESISSQQFLGEGYGPVTPSCIHDLTADWLSLVQTQGRKLQLLKDDDYNCCVMARKQHLTVFLPFFQFFIPQSNTPDPPCSVSIRGSGINVLFRAEHSTVSYFLRLQQPQSFHSLPITSERNFSN